MIHLITATQMTWQRCVLVTCELMFVLAFACLSSRYISVLACPPCSTSQYLSAVASSAVSSIIRPVYVMDEPTAPENQSADAPPVSFGSVSNVRPVNLASHRRHDGIPLSLSRMTTCHCSLYKKRPFLLTLTLIVLWSPRLLHC